MDKFLKNGELICTNAKFVAVGTSQIKDWTEGTPFVIAINTKSDAKENGFDYGKMLKMNVGDIACDEDYKGVFVIRVK